MAVTDAKLLEEIEVAIDNVHRASGFWPRFLVVGRRHYEAITRWRDARTRRPLQPNSYKGIQLVLITDDDYHAVDAVQGAEHEIRAYRRRKGLPEWTQRLPEVASTPEAVAP